MAGLRERERLEDLFGRHVGEQVAREALEQGVELGGETRDVAILFVDVIGSTGLAAEREPHEVVEALNAFFSVVIEVVAAHDGWVNKFEGDAALAVFGAPVPTDDPASSALAAGRELAARLADGVELEAAIGISAGEVVAGNIGEESRFEYTVIGDPVNEAARLTELAKDKPQRLLASERDPRPRERGRALAVARGRERRAARAQPADPTGRAGWRRARRGLGPLGDQPLSHHPVIRSGDRTARRRRRGSRRRSSRRRRPHPRSC